MNRIDREINKMIDVIDKQLIGVSLDNKQYKHLNKMKKQLKKAQKKITKIYNKLYKNSTQEKETTTIYKNIQKTKKEKSIIPENATYTDKVDFKDINKVNISKNICDLPVDAKFKQNGVFDCNITVTDNLLLILKAGSIICLSNNKYANENTQAYRLRQKMIDNGTLEKVKPDGYKCNKLMLTEDVAFTNKKALHTFVVGRELKQCDDSINIMIGDINLDRYIKFGKCDSNE